MDFLNTMIGSILGGGVTGILGVIVQRIADYKNKQLDRELERDKMEHERDMLHAQADIMAQEWAAKTDIASIESSGKIDVADTQAFAQSFSEPPSYSDRVVPNVSQAWILIGLDTLRGLVRPCLTMYLCALTTVMYLQTKSILITHPLDANQGLSLLEKVVSTILFLTETCVLWWFGTRNKQKPVKIN